MSKQFEEFYAWCIEPMKDQYSKRACANAAWNNQQIKIDAIAKVLNNYYLGDYQEIGELAGEISLILQTKNDDIDDLGASHE